MDDKNQNNPVTANSQGVPNDALTPPTTTTPTEKPPIMAFDKPLAKTRPEAGAAPVPPPMIPKKGFPIIKILIGIVTIIVIVVLVMMFLPKSATGKVTLVWWSLWEDSKTMNAIIADFQKENPNITIQYSKEDPVQYRERLATRINKGTGPDIFRFHNSWYPMISDIAAPLPSDVITVDDFKKNYYPVMQSDLIHNGGIYGIPMGADALSLFVNTELLKAAGVAVPKNWDDFVKAAKSLTVKDEEGKIKTSGAALGAYDNVTHAPDIISMLFVQQGVDLKKFSDYVNDEADAIDFYTSFASGDTKIWDSKLDESLMAFSQGKVAMYFGYSWDIFAIQGYNKDLKFSVYPVPRLFNRDITIASYWVEGVSAKSAHQKEAFLFMQYLAKRETAQKLYAEQAKTRPFGVPYARVDLAASLKDNAIVYPFVSQLPHATSSFFASDTYDGEGGLNSLANTYLSKAVNSVILDTSSPGTTIGGLQEGINQVFSKYAVQ